MFTASQIADFHENRLKTAAEIGVRSSLINYDKKGTDVKQQQSGTNNDENALFALRSGHRYGSFSSSRIEVYVFLKRIAKNTGTVDLGGG